MLSIKKKEEQQCSPNILPCRIDHDGPVNGMPRYWTPEKAEGESGLIHDPHKKFLANRPQMAHLLLTFADGSSVERLSNCLRAIEVSLALLMRYPRLTTCQGAILQSTDKALPQTSDNTQADEGNDEEEEDIKVEVKIAEELASFDHVTVWGHESIPTDSEDVYIKGVEEWINFAEAVCL
jgi:ribonuclease H2 subunit C